MSPSAAEEDDDVDEQEADEDEREVDEQLLEVPLGLWVHLDLGRPPDRRLGHVLHPLHGNRTLVSTLPDPGTWIQVRTKGRPDPQAPAQASRVSSCKSASPPGILCGTGGRRSRGDWPSGKVTAALQMRS